MSGSTSSRKIQRLRQAGVRRIAGSRRRPDAFAFVCVMVVVIGVLGVLVARKSVIDAQVLAPAVDQDHWYAAFGVYHCDLYLDPVVTGSDTGTGITVGSDGLISIAPKVPAASGRNAKFGLFADAAGLELTADSFTVNGTTYRTGDSCGTGDAAEPGEVVLLAWPPQANDKVAPEVVTGDDIAGYRFTEDRAIFALALIPAGTADIALPPTVEALTHPGSSTTTVPSSDTVPSTAIAPSTTTIPSTTSTVGRP